MICPEIACDQARLGLWKLESVDLRRSTQQSYEKLRS